MALIDTKSNLLLEARKDHLDTQFQVHSRNLARADVPGARANYVESFAELVNKTPAAALKKTNPQHLQSKNTLRGAPIKTDRSTENMTLSGNNISPEKEMAHLTHVTAERRAVVELQKSTVQLFTMLLR